MGRSRVVNRLNQNNLVVMGCFNWRHALLLAIVFVPLLWIFSLEPIPQPSVYHEFADQRDLIYLPNFMNVLSNIPFLIIGVLGLYQTMSIYQWRVLNGWTLLFIGILLVFAGSSYYHWSPSNNSLVWDRLPMTFGFMGLFVALIGEYVSSKLSEMILLPALFIGILSVSYWHWTDDLRFYYWVQLVPLLTLPIILLLFPRIYSHHKLLFLAFACYVLAKIAEVYDLNIFLATGELISGHTVKHLLAASGCYFILCMLRNRVVIARASRGKSQRKKKA